MDRRSLRPSAVDELERLTLLSGLVPTTAAVGLMATDASSHFTRVHLGGTLTGAFASYLTIDTGTAYRFTGSGSISHLGQVTATGGLGHGLVFQQQKENGRVVIGIQSSLKENGQFVLTGPGGMLSISLTAAVPKGGTLPTDYAYKITGSTGSYAKLFDHGTAHLTLHETPIVFPPGQFNPGAIPAPSGTFTLTFTSAKGR
jgi:hypothetical protein